MYPKEELAQPVGNAKIRGEFDADAATAVGPNTNNAVLFLHLRSDHDGNMTGLSLRNDFGKALQNIGKDQGGQF